MISVSNFNWNSCTVGPSNIYYSFFRCNYFILYFFITTRKCKVYNNQNGRMKNKWISIEECERERYIIRIFFFILLATRNDYVCVNSTEHNPFVYLSSEYSSHRTFLVLGAPLITKRIVLYKKSEIEMKINKICSINISQRKKILFFFVLFETFWLTKWNELNWNQWSYFIIICHPPSRAYNFLFDIRMMIKYHFLLLLF